jgi:WD40 repeat protein
MDAVVRIWDAETGEEIFQLWSTLKKVNVVNFSPDSAMVGAVSWGEAATDVWDVREGKRIATLRGFENISRIFFSEDEKKVYTQGWKAFQTWDLFGEGEVITIKNCNSRGEFAPVLSPDGRMILVGGPDEISGRICDVSTGKELVRLSRPDEYFRAACFSPDGRRLITASNNEYDSSYFARIWDTKTGAVTSTLKGHKNELCNVYFSADGQKAVTCSWDGTARIWSASTGEELLVLRGQEYETLSACFSPYEKRIVTSGKMAYWPDGAKECTGASTARIWDAETGKALLTLCGHEREVWNTVFSPDGKKLLTVSTASDDGFIRTWDASDGKALVEIKVNAYSNTQGLFSPDGQKILTTPAFGDPVPIWDSSTGKVLLKLVGFANDEKVYTINFSPDGKKVIAGSAHGNVRVWDAATGEELAFFKGFEDCIHWSVFSPDGKLILIASGETVKIWPADFLAAALRMKPRNFTPFERERYGLFKY